MIYFGQELGERGMDKEGFSGLDGRTTIFDYWSVETVRQWRNNGLFGNEGLSPDQKKLRDFYIKLIKIAQEDSCINSGKFFDLMYANYENPKFDSTKQYAFLRSDEKEFTLIIANFASQRGEISVRIPDEAYSYMGINPLNIKQAKELFSNKKITLKTGWNETLSVELEPCSGKIIKFYAN